jgi:hypothetical protein
MLAPGVCPEDIEIDMVTRWHLMINAHQPLFPEIGNLLPSEKIERSSSRVMLQRLVVMRRSLTVSQHLYDGFRVGIHHKGY